MASPRPRRDLYGRPLPELAPAQRQVLVHSEHNQIMRRYLLQLLEEDYAHLFQRGVYGELAITLKIENGSLQDEVKLHWHQQHRRPTEER
jgi:hypothetical protein